MEFPRIAFADVADRYDIRPHTEPDGMPGYGWDHTGYRPVPVDGTPWPGQVEYTTPEEAQDAVARHETRTRAAYLVDAAVGLDGDGYRLNAYTRDQYETACAAVGLDPEPDTALTPGIDPDDDPVRHDVADMLWDRRRRRIERDHARDHADILARVDAAVGTGPYTRVHYRAACEEAGVAALADRHALMTADSADAAAAGNGDIRAWLPYDCPVELELARRRVAYIEAHTPEAEAEPVRYGTAGRCAQCGMRSDEKRVWRGDIQGVGGWVCGPCDRDNPDKYTLVFG